MTERLRIGDERDAQGNVLDQLGTGADHVNPDWSKSGSNPDVVTLTPAANECVVEAVESGDINVLFTAEDIVSGAGVQATIPIRVLDASRFIFAFSSPTNLTVGQAVLGGITYQALLPSAAGATVVVTATPRDELDGGVQPSSTYAAGLTGITWTRTGTAVSFNGSPTASGTLVVTLRADEVGASTITLSATNSVGAAVQTSINVLVRGAASAEAFLVPPEG